MTYSRDDTVFNRPTVKRRRQSLRRQLTEPEARLWSRLRGKQPGVRFRRQHGIGPYVVDFYCAAAALVIEVDGDSHYPDTGSNPDAERDEYLRALGMRVLRFTNREVMENRDGVVEEILKWLPRTD